MDHHGDRDMSELEGLGLSLPKLNAQRRRGLLANVSLLTRR